MLINVLFICHGNICRSPMAEFLFKDMVKKEGISDKFNICSAATSKEEIGNPVHSGTKRTLNALVISCESKKATQIKKSDYDKYNYLIVMDSNNLRNINYIIDSDPDKKIYRLLDFSSSPKDIADPWYTGDFNLTYQDIVIGLKAFLAHLYNDAQI